MARGKRLGALFSYLQPETSHLMQNTPLGFPSGVFNIVKLRTAYRAFLATSTMAVKAAGSLMAMSESTLRSSSTPAFFRPFMKAE